jgi:hypothetical protein
VKPRNPFRYMRTRRMMREFISADLQNVDDCSALISSLETDGKGIPTLLKHYLRLNATLLSFNVDKDFSSVVDGLIMVDFTETDAAPAGEIHGRGELPRVPGQAQKRSGLKPGRFVIHWLAGRKGYLADAVGGRAELRLDEAVVAVLAAEEDGETVRLLVVEEHKGALADLEIHDGLVGKERTDLVGLLVHVGRRRLLFLTLVHGSSWNDVLLEVADGAILARAMALEQAGLVLAHAAGDLAMLSSMEA